MGGGKDILSDADKAILRFACCTYNLKRNTQAPSGSPLSLDETTRTCAQPNPPETCDPLHVVHHVQRHPPHSQPKTTSVRPDTAPLAAPPAINDVLLDMAAEFLYSDKSTKTFDAARILRMAFVPSGQTLRPSPSCERIVQFWCEFLVAGLRGDYDTCARWTQQWRLVVECVDALVLNYAMSYRQHPSIQRKVSLLLNKLSEACMSNHSIGLSVLEWVMELAAQLKVQ